MKRFLILSAVALLALAAVACTGNAAQSDEPGATPGIAVGEPAPSGSETPLPDGFETKVVTAPALEAEVVTDASSPSGHAVRLLLEIGDGCHAFERVDVDRDGDGFALTALRTAPARPEVVSCLMLYQTHEQTVALDGTFEAGREYTVNVNDGEHELTFTAS